MKYVPIGAKPVDHGPKMTLEEAADRCKVDVTWLRTFVGRRHIKPLACYANPTRRYYSLLQIRKALREERQTLAN